MTDLMVVSLGDSQVILGILLRKSLEPMLVGLWQANFKILETREKHHTIRGPFQFLECGGREGTG